jgi:putative transposase
MGNDRAYRRSLRLLQYDYRQSGAYFVTICVQARKCLLGEIRDDRMCLNDLGQIVQECWLDVAQHFPCVELDEFAIMPNHKHSVLLIHNDVVRPARSGAAIASGAATAPLRPTLGQVVAYFKYQSSKQINLARQTSGFRFWQRNYYEHVIRDESDLHVIRKYVVENPLKWELDRENPSRY